MSLNKLSKGKRLLIKYFLAEDKEEEQVLFEMYGIKLAATHIMFDLRKEEGIFNKLIVNHLREDPKKFLDFFRLSSDQFNFLIELIKEDLYKQSTNLKMYPITPEEKLCITLR